MFVGCARVDIGLKNFYGENTLISAAKREARSIVGLILSCKGVDVSDVNIHGNTALVLGVF